MRRKSIHCFYLEKSFQKSFSFPKSIFQSIYAYHNCKNNSRKCFNIGLIRTVNLAKHNFFNCGFAKINPTIIYPKLINIHKVLSIGNIAN